MPKSRRGNRAPAFVAAALWIVGIPAAAEGLRAELAACPFKLVFESYRDGNWDLMLMDADGSNVVNVTRTSSVDELYPHASLDGKRVVFVAEEGEGEKRARNVFYMDLEGGRRVQVGQNGRQPFWAPDGRRIGYLEGAWVNYNEGGGANKALRFYDLETGEHHRHPKDDTGGLLNPCWSTCGNWIVSSVMGGMGFGHSIVALELRGDRVIELMRSLSGPDDLYQCRPDLSPDGRRVAWGTGNSHNHTAMWVETADLDLAAKRPRVTNRRKFAEVPYPQQVYHVDWSPDGKYIAYSRGPLGTRMQPAGYVVGTKATGWDIWVVRADKPHGVVQLTHDGLSNKEPDWVFVKAQARR